MMLCFAIIVGGGQSNAAGGFCIPLWAEAIETSTYGYGSISNGIANSLPEVIIVSLLEDCLC